MLIWNKDPRVFSPEESGATPAAATPSVDPPSNPTDPNPEKIGEADEWVLGHFDGLRADDNSEDIDPVEPAPAIPPVVSAQAEKPDSALPSSQPTGEIPQGQPALATPAVVTAASPPPAPVVGAAANQPASPAPLAQTSAVDPTSIMAQIASGIQTQKAAFIKQLAETQYALSEKQIDELGFTPEQAKLWALQLATVHVNTTASITQMQAEQLPVYLNGHLQARSRDEREKEKFFSLYPGLKDVPQAKLAKIFESVSSMHPELKGDDWKKKAGEIAHVSLGIPIPQPVASNGQAAPQTIRTPGPIVRQVNGLMHLPAGTSTAPAPQVPQLSVEERFFELLKADAAGEFDTDR